MSLAGVPWTATADGEYLLSEGKSTVCSISAKLSAGGCWFAGEGRLSKTEGGRPSVCSTFAELVAAGCWLAALATARARCCC